MLKKLKEISGSQLFRITSLNSVSVLIKIAAGLLSAKVTAIFLGPAGMALVGNFRNFLTTIETYATLGLQNGTIKYVAEYQNDEKKLFEILSTIFFITLAAVLCISAILFITSGHLSFWILGEIKYQWVFRLLAISIPLYAGNLIFVAILNGLGNYKQIVYFNIWGNIFGVLLSVFLIWKLQVEGAFIGFVIHPALLFIFSFYFLWKKFPGLPFFSLRFFGFDILKDLLSYSLMGFVTATISPLVYILIRNNIVEKFGVDHAGYWEAMNRVAMFYMLFISTLLSLYFLPKLSMAKSFQEIKTIFFTYYKGLIPLFTIGLAAVYFLRHTIIRVLLTDKFLPTADLFIWQLAGDFFKANSLILGYYFFVKKMTRSFIMLEVISFLIFYLAGIALTGLYGSKGAVIAYAISSLIMLLILVLYFVLKRDSNTTKY